MCENCPEHSSLEVFGYSSKLFRDDEKAFEIDEGKHLISWMGEDSLKIDRFDVRGFLNDLSEHESSFEYKLNGEDKQVEELCDIERYRALSLEENLIDELEEEEVKRRKECSKTRQPYNQVSFSYAESNPPMSDLSLNSNEETSEEPFTSSLCKISIPADVPLPKSKNQNEIIEKTAKFIVSNGTQMEILLKARQANNEKFRFLNINDDLNPYYKLVLEAFKSGTYRDRSETVFEEKADNSKLLSLTGVQSAPNVDTSSSVQELPNSCAYGELVTNIHNLQKTKKDKNP